MTTSAPAGYHTLTPRIFVEDVASMVDFLRATFDATGDLQLSRPSEIRIGDSLLMVSGTEFRGAMPACLYVYVDDLDATYRRALDGGAATMEEPGDTPYGDRRAMVRDHWDNIWQIATRQHPS